MLKFRLPAALARLDLKIGTKLAITVGIGVVLVGGMIVNQWLCNVSVAEQAELERSGQFVTADILRAGVALQRMQTGTREIRLAISEREADEALAALRTSMGTAVSFLQSAIQLYEDAENRQRFETLVKLAKSYADSAAEMVKLKKDYAEITKPLDEVTKTGAQIDALIDKATMVATSLASQRMATVSARITDAQRVSLGFGFFVVVILICAAVFGVLSIGRPIRQIANVLLQLAGGTREFEIPYTARGDEVGDAARAASTFRDNLVKLEKLEAEQKETTDRVMAERKGMVRDLADMFEQAIGNIAGAVSSAAGEMESTAGVLAKNAEATRQLSGEVAVASTQASANVQTAAAATGEVGASIEEIGRRVAQSTAIAAEAVKQAEKTDTQITELSRSAGRIGEVVTLITTIAGQTNLLALNATIEAARAGEYGRGFAVVADEVRKLAESAGKSAEQISKLARDISSQSTAVVSAMKQGIEELTEGREDLGTILRSMGSITDTARKGAEKVHLISQSAREQMGGSEEMVKAVGEISEVAQANASSTDAVSGVIEEQTAAVARMTSAAQELNNLSLELQSVVRRFRLGS